MLEIHPFHGYQHSPTECFYKMDCWKSLGHRVHQGDPIWLDEE